MPIYVYECEECGKEFDALLPVERMDDPQSCPACQAVCTRKLARPARFQRGTGWSARMGGASMPGKM